MAHTVLQFKITLDGVNPPIWRRFQVDAGMNLHDFAYACQAVMGWQGGHLQQFTIGGVYYGIPDEDTSDVHELKDQREYALQDILSEKLKQFRFEYDFGDGWIHTLKLEKSVKTDIPLDNPICLEGVRACPPEDCGGIPGFENLVQAMGDKNHPDREELLEWLGDEYDPEAFDLETVNEELQNLDENKWGEDLM